MKYRLHFQQCRHFWVDVEADSEEEAELKAEEAWDEEPELFTDGSSGVEYEPLPEIDRIEVLKS